MTDPNPTGPINPDLAAELAGDGASSADWQPVIDRLLALPAADQPADDRREAVWQAVQAAMQADASARRAHAERIASELGEPSWVDDIERWLTTSPLTGAPEELREPTWQAVEQAIAVRVGRARELAAELVQEPAAPGTDTDESSTHVPAAELADQQEWAGLIDHVMSAPTVAPSLELREQTWAKLQAELATTSAAPDVPAPAGRVRWLRPVRLAAAALLVAIGAWVVWSVTTPTSPVGPEPIGITAVLGPETIERPLYAATPIETGTQLTVITTEGADYLVDSSTQAHFETANRVSMAEGRIAVIARRRTWIVTTHNPPIELMVIPGADGSPVAMAYIRVNRLVETVTGPDDDNRMHVDCRMVTLARALTLIEQATGTTMRLDGSAVSKRIGSELISLTIDATPDQLPAVFAAVVESRFPVRVQATGDGLVLEALDASGRRGEGPDWVTVEARSGRVLVRSGGSELEATRDLHVRVRSADFFPSHGESSHLHRWPSSAAGQAIPYLPNLLQLDPAGDLRRTLYEVVSIWGNTDSGFQPTVSAIGSTDLNRFDGELRFQPDASGNPGALLFQVGGGCKLLGEGDELNGWTVESIQRTGMHLISADGRERTWLAFN